VLFSEIGNLADWPLAHLLTGKGFRLPAWAAT